MNTDYNLYKIFLYLFEEKSISKTANKLYVSQPAISYSLKELENQLGYTLFYRNSKGIEPTMEAKELYQYISTAFHILKDAEEHIKNLNQLNIGCIRIGIPSYLGSFYCSDVIQQFRKQYPGIQFEIVSESISTMMEMLETRKLDLVIGTLPIESKKEIEKIVLSKLKSCFAYYKDSYKLEKNIHKIDDFSSCSMVLPGKNSSIRSKLDEYLENKNKNLTPAVEAWSMDTLIEMVRRGIGIGYFIDEAIQSQKDKDQFEVLSLNEDLPTIDVCCVYIEDFLTTGSKKFVEFMKEKNKK